MTEPALGWFHRYPARFAPEVVGTLLDAAETRLGRVPSLVLDPFAGTGATLAGARQRGWPSIGVELSQLGVLIAELRLDPPDDLEGAVRRVEEWVANVNGYGGVVLPTELIDWIGPANAAAVGSYLRRLRAIRDARVKRFITIALSSALRPASRWLPGSIKPQVDAEREPPSINPIFLRAARRLAADCRHELCESSTAARVVEGSALSLPLEGVDIDAVVSSPPYYVTYDYFDVQRLSYLTFGWKPKGAEQVGRRYHVSPDGVGFRPPRSMEEWYRHTYRSEETVLGRALRAYLCDLETHFAELQRVMVPGGVIVYAVGNSTRRGRVFDLASALAEVASAAGFADVEVAERQQASRRILPAGRDTISGRFSSETSPGVAECVVSARKPYR